jgi:phospholipase/lecithinase/hemolysin
MGLAGSRLAREVSQLSGVKIMSLDVRALFDQMLANPPTFGFTDVTDSALGITVLDARAAFHHLGRVDDQPERIDVLG